MQTSDEALIFEKYQQLNEIGLLGGQQYSFGNRLGAWAGKKLTGGLLGKGAQANVNIEKDTNHFLRTLQNDARHAGTTVKELLKTPQSIINWVKQNIKIDATKMPNWENLSKLAASGGNRDVYNLLNNAVKYRNTIHRFGASKQAAANSTTPQQTPAAETPQQTTATPDAVAPQPQQTPAAEDFADVDKVVAGAKSAIAATPPVNRASNLYNTLKAVAPKNIDELEGLAHAYAQPGYDDAFKRKVASKIKTLKFENTSFIDCRVF